MTQNAINMKSLYNLNKLANMLINIYSFNLSREDAKKIIFKDELNNIVEKYKKIYPNTIINKEIFEKEYINPFINSWNMIKKKCIKYKCRDLRASEKQMDINLPLYYFLVDDGDINGGIFLASAYQHLIEWQNSFLNEIISKNNTSGILNNYVSQLEQQINVQEATKDEIINIDNQTFQSLEELISNGTIINSFSKDKNNIVYINYNDIIYNYEYIEEELGKIILPGLKKFKPGEIKFVTYLYEAFRVNDKDSILTIYNFKYIQKDLLVEEKYILNELLQKNDHKLYNEVFTSLQILMNEIVKENYEQGILIYDIIEKLPNYIILNKELLDLLRKTKEKYVNEKIFTINSLVSIYEYFEDLCWPEINKNILPDYSLILSDENKKYVLSYFNKIDDQKKIINIENFTIALRRLISRYLVGSKQEVNIKSDLALILYIQKNEYWSKEIADKDEKDKELDEICIEDIKIGNAFNLYNILGGDSILNKIIEENKKIKIDKGKRDNERKNEELIFNTNENINDVENKENYDEENIDDDKEEKKKSDESDDGARDNY